MGFYKNMRGTVTKILRDLVGSRLSCYVRSYNDNYLYLKKDEIILTDITTHPTYQKTEYHIPILQDFIINKLYEYYKPEYEDYRLYITGSNFRGTTKGQENLCRITITIRAKYRDEKGLFEYDYFLTLYIFFNKDNHFEPMYIIDAINKERYDIDNLKIDVHKSN